jgi:hypothetical protein
MELFIEVDENGNAVNHPLLGDNLRLSYPDGIPNKYQPFTRIPRPDNYSGGPDDFPSYQKVNGVWQDVWLTT